MSKTVKTYCGSALISALFIMTLIAIAATAMSTRLQSDIYRTRLTLLSDNLYLASQGVSFWAMGELSSPKKYTQATAQGKILEFPAKYQTLYPGLVVEGALYDLQGRFNLNNVIDKKYFAVFVKLIANAARNLPPNQQSGIGIAVYQWVSPFKSGLGKDEWVSYYLQQKPPYFPSQQLMQSVSEFRLVRGVDAKTYQLLESFITALPEATPINLNTASKKVLKSLGNGLSEEQVNELITARGEKGIKQKEISLLLQKLNIRQEQTTLESQYFMSVAVVKGDDLNLINYSILKRSKNKDGKISVSLIRQSLNSY